MLSLLLAACGGSGSGSDGSEGITFDTGTGFNSFVQSIETPFGGSGDLYAGGGFSTYRGIPRNRVARINRDGSLDSDFDPGSGFSGNVICVALATDGSGDLYVGGAFTSFNGTGRNRIARLNSDGTLDTDFDPGTGFDHNVGTIVPTTDGSGDIYVGGVFNSFNGTSRDRIARINSDGSNDGGFNPGTGFNSTARSIAIASDGSGDLYVGGAFTSFNGTDRSRVVRLDIDGTVDAGFDPGTGFDGGVYSVLPATDGSGDLFVSGSFTSYSGVARNGIVRIDSNGALETGFDPGTGFNDTVWQIAFATDGSGDIYAGGLFTTFQEFAANRVSRLDSTGTRN